MRGRPQGRYWNGLIKTAQWYDDIRPDLVADLEGMVSSHLQSGAVKSATVSLQSLKRRSEVVGVERHTIDKFDIQVDLAS